MFLRMLCTAVALLFAILAFCGIGPMPSVWGRVSFGLGFLLIAFLVWRSWRFIVGDFSPPSWTQLLAAMSILAGGKPADER
jgi:hypothetical protein